MIYQVSVRGKVDPGWSDWINGMEASSEVDQAGQEITVFTGCVSDQAALRGILNHLWDLNLTILSVNLIHPPANTAGDERRPVK